MHKHNSHDLWDKIWRDPEGKVVIFQWPNVWLIAWAVVTMVSLFTRGTVFSVCYWLADAILAVWAILEITKGVNYFRKALGVIVLIFVIISVIHGLQ